MVGKEICQKHVAGNDELVSIVSGKQKRGKERNILGAVACKVRGLFSFILLQVCSFHGDDSLPHRDPSPYFLKCGAHYFSDGVLGPTSNRDLLIVYRSLRLNIL